MPFVRSRYPKDWRDISARIRREAGNRCQCTGYCGDTHDDGRCDAPNGKLIVRGERYPWRWSEHSGCSLCLAGDPECRPVRVVLTVAHLDHDTTNNTTSNLAALCQRCHLRLDRHQHATNARATRRGRKAAGDLPGL